jgi:hypothetical protein
MTIQLIHARILLSTVVLAAGACATDGGSPSSSGDSHGVAAGAVEDTLSACMSRIPSDASEGQRMVAQESCKRDQANRK